MEIYLFIKFVHVITAILSVTGFCLRAWWLFNRNKLLQHRLVKVIPHINDTLLLSAAIYLAFLSGINPIEQSWLGAKIILLLGYIVAGSYALKRGKDQQIRISSFVIALLCVLTIFLLAVTKPNLF